VIEEEISKVAGAIGSESPNKGRNKALWEAVKGVGFVEDPDGVPC
jgi:hypothetical protein